MNVKLDLKIIAPKLKLLLEHLVKGDPIEEIINEMRLGWQNPASPSNQYVIESINLAWKAQNGILECGSGFTSILLNLIANCRQIPMISLEQDQDWFEITRGSLKFLKLPYDNIIFTPLKESKEYSWYSLDNCNLKNKYDLVICDGPPGSVLGGRRGLLPEMFQQLTHDCIILLDDSDRPGEKEVLKIWSENFPIKTEILGKLKQYARLKINSIESN
jgi:hypothetical protein